MKPRHRPPRGAAGRRSCACPTSDCRCAHLRRHAPARPSIASRAGDAACGLKARAGAPTGRGSGGQRRRLLRPAQRRARRPWLFASGRWRRPAVADNMRGQVKYLHGGLPESVDSQLSASEAPFLNSSSRLISIRARTGGSVPMRRRALRPRPIIRRNGRSPGPA